MTTSSEQNPTISIVDVPASEGHLRPEVTAYAERLVRELDGYRRYFDDIDAAIGQLPAADRAHAEATVIGEEGPTFFAFLDDRLAELEALDATLSPEERAAACAHLRERVWRFILCSEFLARTNLRPRGYAGDSVLMQWIYDEGYLGASTFGKLLHKHPVETPAAQAVRNRRQMIADEARAAAAEREGGAGPLRIMSVACGPAWELRDLFATGADAARYAITLLDQDSEAIAEARAGVEDAARSIAAPIDATYLCESVRTPRSGAELAEAWGRFDLIYSMGLFDYLGERTAKALVAKLYEMLEPGGRMIIGNYHVGNPTRCYMEYWMSWPLLYRTEEELMALADGLAGAERSLSFEATGSQMYLEVRKP